MGFLCACAPDCSLKRGDSRQLSLHAPGIRRNQLPLLAKLAHLLCLVSSNSEVRTRFPRAQQGEADLTVFGQIHQRIGLVDRPSVLKPSRTSQAVALVA
jgi:hypothetical protein